MTERSIPMSTLLVVVGIPIVLFGPMTVGTPDGHWIWPAFIAAFGSLLCGAGLGFKIGNG